ncbi:MAG TPA: small ribosomal subunit Rsm22 family protein, partial [Blastocatellia bacterium]|nr:small ribosomal subunit Rsm22 family protein [Blastocatellia bacterium]
MQLPLSLRNAIEQEILKLGTGPLTKAAAELSERYRRPSRPAHPEGQFITGEAQRLAYLAVRMPATFAAAHAVLSEVRRLAPEGRPEGRVESLLDLGAGTGAASWAAAELFPDLQRCTLIEQDRQLIELGRRLAESSESPALKSGHWQQLAFPTKTVLPPHDLVICSYVLGEIGERELGGLLDSAWQAASRFLVIIEPGTRRGFELIRTARETLLRLGGRTLAPCPHQNACPMPADDWCHFSRRVERSSLHRRLKGAELGYEDEKFSYVAVTREPLP